MNKDSKSLDNIVFADRNKEYGAYFLRSQYNRIVVKAILIAVTVFILGFVLPFITNYFIKEKAKTFDNYIYVAYGGIDKPPAEIIIEPKSSLKKIVAVKNVFKEPEIVPSDSLSDTTYFIQDFLNQLKNRNSNDTASTAQLNANVGGEGGTGDSIYLRVQYNPSFPGGETEMRRFLTENTQYPASALDYGIQGTVRISFIVEKDGHISDIHIENGIGGGCNEEALRVIKKMPPWYPGKQYGKNVRVRVVLPFRFALFR